MRKRASRRPEVGIVRRFLDYDRDTGGFVWKQRTPVDFSECEEPEFSCKAWNARYAGASAGYVDQNGYVLIRLCGVRMRGHVLAWAHATGAWPKAEIDHINLDKADNRLSNLREATRSQNLANCRPRIRNFCGLKGAHWLEKNQKWRASISLSGKTKHLGHFDTAEDAHRAYCTEAAKVFGEFARAK